MSRCGVEFDTARLTVASCLKSTSCHARKNLRGCWKNMTLLGNSTGEMVVSASEEARRVPDDAELLRRTAHDDPTAFRELVNRHARYLYGIAFSLSGNAADAEDLVQETFAATLKSQYRGEAAVRTWLVQILVRQAAKLRGRRKHPAGGGRVGVSDQGAAGLEPASDVVGTGRRAELAGKFGKV